jgi:hypothetical protein
MINADQLETLADKAGLELEKVLQGIPCRAATCGEEDALEHLWMAAEVELGHTLDERVLWGVYLHRLCSDLSHCITQMGSGEYILYERLSTNPAALQKTSTQGFPCRVTLTRDGDRGILGLDLFVANYRPHGMLPIESGD